MITTLKEYDSVSTSEQQRDISDFVGRYVQCCQTSLVEWVLNKSFEDADAPLQHDDITNNSPTGSIEISGYWEDLTETDRDAKLEHYEYLRDKAQETFDLANDKLDSLDCDSEEYSTLYDRIDKFEAATVNRLIDICDDLEILSFENYPEIYEWWACDRWLIARLEERGECTLDGEYWGRCTTGQAISLDSVIIDIRKSTFLDS